MHISSQPPPSFPSPTVPTMIRAIRWCRRQAPWARWGMALGCVGVAFLLRLSLDLPPTRLAFVLFLPAIALAGVMGRWPGLFSALLSAALASYFFMAPTFSFVITNTPDFVSLAVFTITAMVTAAAVDAMAVAQEHAERERQRAERSEWEKDILLADLGHRVKNDIQRLSAVLLMQARAAQDNQQPEIAAALRAAAKRTSVISRVHERLSQHHGALMVNARDVLDGLAQDVQSSLLGGPIKLIVDADIHLLPVNRAGALGMMANELITNALKHAFPLDREGDITIRFFQEAGDYTLRVEDNGAGLSAKPGDGMGRKIVRALAAQLGGRLELRDRDEGSGVVAQISFPVAQSAD